MEPENKTNGSLVGLVVIIIILIIGGIYVWVSKINTESQLKQNPAVQTY